MVALQKLFIEHPLYGRPALANWDSSLGSELSLQVTKPRVRRWGWVEPGSGSSAPGVTFFFFFFHSGTFVPVPPRFLRTLFRTEHFRSRPAARRGLRAEALTRVRRAPPRPRAPVPGPHGRADPVCGPPPALGPQRAAGGAVQSGGAGEAVLRGDGER